MRLQSEQVRLHCYAPGHFDLTCVTHMLTVDSTDLATVWHDVSRPLCSHLAAPESFGTTISELFASALCGKVTVDVFKTAQRIIRFQQSILVFKSYLVM